MLKQQLQCWGCNRAATLESCNQEDYDAQLKNLVRQGWRRRIFGTNASPWFCSEDCACNSYNAKRAEEWWSHKTIVRNNEIFKMSFLGGTLGLILIGMFCLSMGWCN
jgi:hypothetical protein